MNHRYKNDAQIIAMNELVGAFQRKDIKDFERVLREHASTLLNDPFIKSHMDQVLKKIRLQVLVKLVKPYTRIELRSLAQVDRPTDS